jgi:N-acetylneuraminate synthase
MGTETVDLGSREVGDNCPCFVIAEAGVNHNGSLALALELVDAAAEAGADAVKFQTFRAAALAASSAPKASYQRQDGPVAETQQQMLERLELNKEAHAEVIARCRRRQLIFLSSPFDEESADFLASLDVPAFKIPSGEVTNLGFLAHVAAHNKPLIVSTGMSSLSEVERAVEAVERCSAAGLVLLHCVSNYPAAASDANLRAMITMRGAFGHPVGYSDHVPGNRVCLAAVALGACVVEKHFTTSRALPGPDHSASLEPDELKELVSGIREVESALGNGRKRPASTERDTAACVRKSIVTSRRIEAGERLTPEMLVMKRPGTGIPPAWLEHVVGRTARTQIPADTLLTLDLLT